MIQFALGEMARSLLLFIPLSLGALLPGVPAALAAAPGRPRSLGALLSAAFAVNLGLVSVASALSWVMGGSLHAAMAMYGALALLCLPLLAGRPWRNQQLQDVDFSAGWLVGALVLVLPQGAWYSVADSFYHWAAARSLLLDNVPLPVDPIYGTAGGALDPTSGSWHTLLAIWSSVLGMDPSRTAGALNLLLAVVVGIGFYGLARRFARPRWAAAATLAFFLGAFGLDLRALWYPNQVVVACLIAVATLAFDLAQSRDWRAAAALGLAVAGALLIHPAGTTSALVELGLIGLLLLAQSPRADVRVFRRQLLLLVASTVAALAVAAGPLLSRAGVLLHNPVQTGGYYDLGTTFVSLPLGVCLPLPLRYAGLDAEHQQAVGRWLAVVFMLAAAAFLAYLLTRARSAAADRWQPAAVALVAVAPFVPPVSALMVAVSPQLFVRTGLPLGLAWYLAAAAAGSAAGLPSGRMAWSRRKPRMATARGPTGARPEARVGVLAAGALLLVSLAAAPAPLATLTGKGSLVPGREMTFGQSWATDARLALGTGDLAAAAALFGADRPVVAADPTTDYYLVGLLPVRALAVAETHSPVLEEATSGIQRRQAAETLLAATAPLADKAVAALQFGVSFVAVSKYTPHRGQVEMQLARDSTLFHPELVSPGLSVYRVVVPAGAPAADGPVR